MKIAIIILHFGKIETTRACLRELSKKIDGNQLIIINNTPADITSLTKIVPHTILIDNRTNLGFAKGVNQGIRRALEDTSIEAVFLMNNDLTLSFGNFNQLALTYGKFPAAGIVSPILHHSGGPASPAGVYDWGGQFNKWTGMVKHKNWGNKPKTILSVTHVAGAAMLIKKVVIEKIGMLDERFFLYYEDLDFCLRAFSADYTIHINPDIVAEHEVSAGSNALGRTRYQWRSHLQFVTKHLFKKVHPTAYLYDLIFYPLILVKIFLRSLIHNT
jgi:GT2 family glycosyltransferase